MLRPRRIGSPQPPRQYGAGIQYRFDGTASDFLGLAVYNKTQGTAPTFYLRVTPSAIFTDGFDGE